MMNKEIPDEDMVKFNIKINIIKIASCYMLEL